MAHFGGIIFRESFVILCWCVFVVTMHPITHLGEVSLAINGIFAAIGVSGVETVGGISSRGTSSTGSSSAGTELSSVRTSLGIELSSAATFYGDQTVIGGYLYFIFCLGLMACCWGNLNIHASNGLMMWRNFIISSYLCIMLARSASLRLCYPLESRVESRRPTWWRTTNICWCHMGGRIHRRWWWVAPLLLCIFFLTIVNKSSKIMKLN